MLAYTAPRSYNSSLMAAISGYFWNTLSSKSFFMQSFHVSTGWQIMSFNETSGRRGVMCAKASRVETKMSGFTSTR